MLGVHWDGIFLEVFEVLFVLNLVCPFNFGEIGINSFHNYIYRIEKLTFKFQNYFVRFFFKMWFIIIRSVTFI